MESEGTAPRLRVGSEMPGLVLGDGDGYGPSLACPVCGFGYCHVHAPSYMPRDEGWGRREGYLAIPVEGEIVTTQRVGDVLSGEG